MSDHAPHPRQPEPHPPTWVVDRTERARLWITGPDRAKFLHNLCTQDIKGLPAGSGREAFLTDPQGRTLAYVTIHIGNDALLVRTDAGALEQALPHLRKYGIFDDVTLDDRTLATREWHLAGPGADEALTELELHAGPLPSLGIIERVVETEPVVVIREAPYGREGWTVITAVGAEARWVERLSRLQPAAVVLAASDPLLEGLRILAGTPKSGRDVTSANLPQEIDRDAQAISFTKGCYLGQETVARLDALGHVNKILRRLTIEGDTLPTPGALVRSGERDLGMISSVGRLPDGRAVALALLRVNLAPVGATVEVVDPSGPRPAHVHALTGASTPAGE